MRIHNTKQEESKRTDILPRWIREHDHFKEVCVQKVLYECPCSLVENNIKLRSNGFLFLIFFLFLPAGKQVRAIIGIVFRWWADRGYM